MQKNKVWNESEIKEMWPQTLDELRGFQRTLEAKAVLTASQLGMVLQLAEAGFKEVSQAQQTKNKAILSVEVLDQIEALFDHIIIQFNKTARIPDLLLHFQKIDNLWFQLKQAREKAERPKPTLH